MSQRNSDSEPVLGYEIADVFTKEDFCALVNVPNIRPLLERLYLRATSNPADPVLIDDVSQATDANKIYSISSLNSMLSTIATALKEVPTDKAYSEFAKQLLVKKMDEGDDRPCLALHKRPASADNGQKLLATNVIALCIEIVDHDGRSPGSGDEVHALLKQIVKSIPQGDGTSSGTSTLSMVHHVGDQNLNSKLKELVAKSLSLATVCQDRLPVS